MNYFLSPEEIRQLGLASVGTNVTIDRAARLIHPQRMHLGDHVRIDAFCILSAGPDGIRLGNHVHIGAGAYIFGGGGAVVMEDFSGLSGRVSIYTANDDYLHGHLTNPTVPEQFRQVRTGPVTLRRHCIVGAGSTILPGVELGWGSSVGAMVLVQANLPDCAVLRSQPARRAKLRRDRAKLERIEQELQDFQNAARCPPG
jgi:galactoside O-acetyltransferase